MVAIGGAALFGTLVTNVSLWVSIAKGLTLSQAYAQMGYDLTAPTELLSLATILLSGFWGGYVSALYGGGRHLAQAAVAGTVGASFFLVMNLSPSQSPTPGWYVPLCIAAVVFSSLAGGFAYERRA